MRVSHLGTPTVYRENRSGVSRRINYVTVRKLLLLISLHCLAEMFIFNVQQTDIFLKRML